MNNKVIIIVVVVVVLLLMIIMIMIMTLLRLIIIVPTINIQAVTINEFQVKRGNAISKREGIFPQVELNKNDTIHRNNTTNKLTHTNNNK